jgi:hypothetical protein
MEGYQINSTLLCETIKNNPLTVVFQQAERNRGGKFTNSHLSPELAIASIMNAFNSGVNSKDLIIVPVAI